MIHHTNELQTNTGHNGNPSISFHALTGSRTSNNVVDGIVQALLPGQNRLGIVDWACDNFVRFAYTLDFIQYNQTDDAFTITNLGLRLSQAATVQDKFDILKLALKQYSPAVRVLELLYNQFEESPQNPSLTKFEIGQELGFKGEDGFTTYNQNVFIQALNTALTAQDRNKIKSNWEGSSDKYARMICGWLMNENINWVQTSFKTVSVQIGQDIYTEVLQSYQITAAGVTAFRSCRPYSRNSGTAKKVSFEMLATKGSDVNFLRLRRALTLNFLNRARNLQQIQNHLTANNLNNIPTSTIVDDIRNFTRIGLQVEEGNNAYRVKDTIELLQIPAQQTQQLTPSNLTQAKQNLSQQINHLPHTFFDLLDLSMGGQKQARQFEVRIVALLNLVIAAKHLSGGNRPEIIAYYPNANPADCAIFDSKSYAGGFNIPAAERDKMIRYVNEYNAKNTRLNPNRWWENFQSPIYPTAPIKYGFASSSFAGDFQSRLQYILQTTGANGCAITAETLIKKVDKILNPNEPYTAHNFFDEIGNNNLVI